MRSTSEPAEKRQPPKTIGRDELNLAEFPISSLSHRVADGCKELVFQDEIRDQATGDMIPRKLTVTGDVKYGLPNPQDDDVIVALIYITKSANNFGSRIVPFNRMAVVELLGWARNGQSLHRLDESLNRWLGVTLRYENAWWDKSAQTWVNESFHILDNLTMYDQQTIRRIKRNAAQPSLPLSTFAWNDIVFRSFQAENLKRLDLSLYFKLSLAPSKRAYRFLDKRFYRSPNLKFDLRTFACGKIGFSPDYTPAKIKEKLQPTLDELEQIGFLAPLSREQRYEKIGHGQWEIMLVRGDEGKLAASGQIVEASKSSSLADALTKRGVSDKTAAELVAEHPAESIQLKLDVFDWLAEKQDKRVAKSPEGYLVKSITDDYKTPKGFVSAAERRQQQEAKQAREQKAAEDRRRQQQADAAERAEREAVAAYWEALTPEQQAQLQADANAQADPESLAQEFGPLKRMGQHVRRDQYIRQLLKQRQPAES